MSEDGWITLPRFVNKYYDTHLIDFSFENPEGKLSKTPVMEYVLKNFSKSVFLVPTSYCNYGYPYRKRTIFVTSMKGFKPKPPCPTLMCPQVAELGYHPSAIGSNEYDNFSANKKQRNSIPPVLIDVLVDSWMKRHTGEVRAFLLIDVFSGWGSIQKRVRKRKAEGSLPDNLKVYSNDIAKSREADFDMDMDTWTPGNLLLMALVQSFGSDSSSILAHPLGVDGWVQDNKVAVLFHMSTPCETYSVCALRKHRVRGSAHPKSQEAADADYMNFKLMSYVCRVALGKQLPSLSDLHAHFEAPAAPPSESQATTPVRASALVTKPNSKNTPAKRVTFKREVEHHSPPAPSRRAAKRPCLEQEGSVEALVEVDEWLKEDIEKSRALEDQRRQAIEDAEVLALASMVTARAFSQALVMQPDAYPDATKGDGLSDLGMVSESEAEEEGPRAESAGLLAPSVLEAQPESSASELLAGGAQPCGEARAPTTARNGKPPRKLPWGPGRPLSRFLDLPLWKPPERCNTGWAPTPPRAPTPRPASSSTFTPTSLGLPPPAAAATPAPPPPSPSVGGAPKALSGMSFVLTGTFSELGGGEGINLGKERVADLIKSHGARVCGSVSKKTTALLVGNDPGAGKVREAAIRDVVMINLKGLHQVISGRPVSEADCPDIGSFSTGYDGSVAVPDREAQFLRSEAKRGKHA